MRRAQYEFNRQLGKDIKIVPDAVRTEPNFMTLFAEYNKYLLRRISPYGSTSDGLAPFDPVRPAFLSGTLVYVLTVIAVAPIGDRPVQAVVHAWSAFHHLAGSKRRRNSNRVGRQDPGRPIPHRREASVDDGSGRHAALLRGRRSWS
jgi:hypothetical protein